jgi:hypothetical protein
VILQQTSGIAMDRENIGGNMSGQQSNYVSRGGNPFNNKWSLDGIDITDMAATGGSPTYYDFDAFEEMTINTVGVDVTQQTGGVGINLVTKSGGDRFRGSSRFYVTDDRFESNNITDAQRNQGASSGGPVQNIKDYGVEAGGPIKKGKAWIWGSYGKQNINVGVLGFFLPTSDCQTVKATPLNYSIKDINACLNSDTTLLQTTNLKADVQLFKGNKLSLFNSFSKKRRNARNASDLTPPESTVRQATVSSTYGKWGWITGPSPTYKFDDQWVVSDRTLVDVQYAHVGNNFILDYHEDALRNVQPTFIISTCLNGRSTPDNGQSVNIRPVNQVQANVSYFLPGRLGGDHSLKVGGYWKDAYSYNSTHTAGDATARFPTAVSNDCSLAATRCQTNVVRDGLSRYDLKNISLYAQDTLTHGRLTTQPRAPLRLQPRPGAGRLRRGEPAGAGDSPGHQLRRRGSRREVQQPLAARWLDVRRARRWQDARESELRDVLGPGRHERRVGHRQSRVAHQHPLPVGGSERRQTRSGERNHHHQWRAQLPEPDRRKLGPRESGKFGFDELGRSEFEERSNG